MQNNFNVRSIRIQESVNMNVSSAFVRICFLVALLQIYIVITALILQRLEKDSEVAKDGLLEAVLRAKNEIIKNNNSYEIIDQLRKVFEKEKELEVRKRFEGIENAYLFTMMSFTTLGNSGLRPTTSSTRLFYVFVIPFGFALYIVIIVTLAYHLRDAMLKCITSIEHKQYEETKFLNTKILLISFTTCVIIILLGGIFSLLKNRSYLYGVYASLDALTFVGNEKILTRGSSIKVYFSFLLSLLLMFMHSLILVFVCNCQQALDEIVGFVTGGESVTFCFQAEGRSHSKDYKEKLMASFASPDSTEILKENEGDEELAFPQLWNMTYEFEPDILGDHPAIGGPGRRELRLSDLFNSQKEMFEPIIEHSENMDAEMSDSSSYKSTKEYFEKEGINIGSNENSDNEQSSGQSTPKGSNCSVPSSFSNISLREFEFSEQ